jgi:Ca-activated chloride channel family protein
VSTIANVGRLIESALANGRGLGVGDLHFRHGDAAWLTIVVLAAVAFAMVVLRSTVMRRGTRHRVGLPALLAPPESFSWSGVRHVPLLLFVVGLPALVLAVADPYSSLVQREESFPGRRICLMIDASRSMVRPFSAPTLRQAGNSSPTGSSSQATFLTTVAAADRFVQLRAAGGYRDLIALVEFGDQAYVVTPFTTDIDNIRLSLSLVGDYVEFVRFPDQGTVIGRAIEQSVELFRTFDFLDASGNIMVLFSDGDDSEVLDQGRSVSELVQRARAAHVPIYFVRTRFDRTFGSVVSDASWRDAVEATGGKYYAASDEATILRAIQDIDRVAAGRIAVKAYVNQRPRFGSFALVAAGTWSLAALLTLTVPYFRRFP